MSPRPMRGRTTDVTAQNHRRTEELSSIFTEKRTRLEKTLNGYFATDSLMERGGYVWATVRRLSSLEWTRFEVLRPVLRELDKGERYLRYFDEGLGRRRELLEELEKESKGVGTADVLFHDSDRIMQLMAELRDEVLRYDRYEAAELVPFIERSIDAERLERLGNDAMKESTRHVTHPHPYQGALDHLGPVGAWIASFDDWLDDLGQHPDDTIEGKGQQGN